MAQNIALKDQTIEHSATGMTPAYDISGFSALDITFIVTEMSGTSPVVDLVLEHSPDKVHWRSLYEDFHQGVFMRKDAVGSETIRICKFSRYIRASWEMGGTSPVVKFEIYATAR